MNLSDVAKVVKSCVSGKNTKEKAVNKAHSSGNFADVELFVEEILHKTSRLLLSEVKRTVCFLAISNLYAFFIKPQKS